MIFFIQGFDNLRSQSVTPPQWTMRNVDDRYLFNNECINILGLFFSYKHFYPFLLTVVGIAFCFAS